MEGDDDRSRHQPGPVGDGQTVAKVRDVSNQGQSQNTERHHAKVHQVFGPVGAESGDPKSWPGEGAHQRDGPDGMTSGGAVGHTRTGDGVVRS